MAEYPNMALKDESIDQQLSLLPDLHFKRFLEFHEANPRVYQTLRELAFEWKNAGNKKIGIAMLFEVMRWTEGLRPENKDPDGFSLNNNHRAHYARMLMTNEPELRDMFEVRVLRTF